MYNIINNYSEKIFMDIEKEEKNIVININKINDICKKYIKDNDENYKLEKNINRIKKNINNIKNIIIKNKLNIQNDTINHTTDKLKDINENILEEMINSLNFNANNYKNNDELLCMLVLIIFKKTLDLEFIKINENKLKLFIMTVNRYYKNNPFHNFTHAVSVLQFTYLIVSNIEINNCLLNYRLFGLMISCITHDIDHPGNTNSFERKIKSNLALMYNDNSVLENHHCATTFYILNLPEIKLLEDLNTENYSLVRETIIDCILSTDMKFHFDLVDSIKNFKYNFNEKANEKLFCKMIIHVADLSNQLRNFEIAYGMSQQLRKEFIFQVDKEKKLNLESESYMLEIINDDDNFYQSEINFCTNFIEPLIKIFCFHFPNLKYMLRNLKLNIDKWKKLLMHEVIKDELFFDNENYEKNINSLL